MNLTVCAERIQACSKRMDTIESLAKTDRAEIWSAVDEIRRDNKSLLRIVSMIMGGAVVIQAAIQFIK